MNSVFSVIRLRFFADKMTLRCSPDVWLFRNLDAAHATLIKYRKKLEHEGYKTERVDYNFNATSEVRNIVIKAMIFEHPPGHIHDQSITIDTPIGKSQDSMS